MWVSDPCIRLLMMVEKRRQRGSKNGGFLEPLGLGLDFAARHSNSHVILRTLKCRMFYYVYWRPLLMRIALLTCLKKVKSY